MSMGDVLSGKVWKFGDDINTDLVIPNFAVLMTKEEQLEHVFSANRPGWKDEVQPGDVLLAGRNFGVGSARPIGDMFVGARGERRRGRVVQRPRICGTASTSGCPSLPCPGILDAFEEGDVAEVDWKSGAVRNVTKGHLAAGRSRAGRCCSEIVIAGGVEAVLRKEGYLVSK